MGTDDKEEPVDYGEVVGRDFLDKFLLAIIDAYPVLSTPPASAARDRDIRLRDAKEALVGQAHNEGRPLVSDEAYLRWMGSERYKDLARRDMAKIKGTKPPKLRSDRKLADLAVEKFDLPTGRAENLRKKFGKQRSKWLDVARYHDDVPEALDFSLLEQIKAILEKREIEMNLKRIER